MIPPAEKKYNTITTFPWETLLKSRNNELDGGRKEETSTSRFKHVRMNRQGEEKFTCTVACCLFFEFIIRNLHRFMINTSSERADWSVSQEWRDQDTIKHGRCSRTHHLAHAHSDLNSISQGNATQRKPSARTAAGAFSQRAATYVAAAAGMELAAGGHAGRYRGPVGAGARSIRSDRWRRPSGERGPKLSAPRPRPHADRIEFDGGADSSASRRAMGWWWAENTGQPTGHNLWHRLRICSRCYWSDGMRKEWEEGEVSFACPLGLPLLFCAFPIETRVESPAKDLGIRFEFSRRRLVKEKKIKGVIKR